MANSRILDVGPEHVTFRTKCQQTATLHPLEFLRRVVQHVLPDGFHKIRYAGLYALTQSGGVLGQARALLPAPKPQSKAQPVVTDGPRICVHCGAVILRLPLTAMPRSPSLEAACA